MTQHFPPFMNPYAGQTSYWEDRISADTIDTVSEGTSPMPQYLNQSLFAANKTYIPSSEATIGIQTTDGPEPRKPIESDQSIREHYNGTRIYKLSQKLNRKFVAQDVKQDPMLLQTAIWFAAEVYDGDFEYMIDMKRSIDKYGRLTENQAKGVLNVMVNEFKRHLDRRDKPAPAPVHAGVTVRNGYYTVVQPDGSRITLRIKDDFRKDSKGQLAGVLVGSDNTSDYANFAFIEDGGKIRVWRAAQSYAQGSMTIAPSWIKALTDLFNGALDAEEAGMAYALTANRCRRCGRMLTVPASINAGYGPECAGKI